MPPTDQNAASRAFDRLLVPRRQPRGTRSTLVAGVLPRPPAHPLVAKARAQDLASKGYERAAPAGHESQLAYGSPVFAAGGIPSSWLLRLTDSSSTERLGSPLPVDLRCVRQLAAYGLHEDHREPPSLRRRHVVLLRACRAGGSIFDFGGRWFQLGTKGRPFLDVLCQPPSALADVDLPSSAARSALSGRPWVTAAPVIRWVAARSGTGPDAVGMVTVTCRCSAR